MPGIIGNSLIVELLSSRYLFVLFLISEFDLDNNNIIHMWFLTALILFSLNKMDYMM